MRLLTAIALTLPLLLTGCFEQNTATNTSAPAAEPVPASKPDTTVRFAPAPLPSKDDFKNQNPKF